jgi:hypothetical protein
MPMPSLPRFLRSPWTWIIVAALVAGYAAAGFVLLPRLAADGIRTAFRDRFHRTATVGQISFNPFTLEVEAREFAVADADGGPLLAFDRLYINLRLASLLLAAPDFKAIALDGLRLRVVRRPDGRLNIQDLIPPPDPKARPDAPPPRLWINELTIRGGEATLVDEAGGNALHVTLKPISFALRDFSTRSEGNAYSLVARSSRDEGLEWRGTFGLRPLESQGRFVLKAVKAETIAELARELLPVGLSSGQLDLSGSYEFAERGDSLALRAKVEELTVTALGLRTAGESADWLQVPRTRVTGTSIDFGARSLAVGLVAIERPHLLAARARDGSLSLARVLAAPVPATAAAPAASSAPKPWTITVPDIRLSAAVVDFEDRVPPTPATFHVAPIEIGVRGFASPATAPLAVELNAGVNDGGRLAVKGSLALEPLAGTFSLEAGALALAALQPYLASATALTLKGGTAQCKGTLVLRPGGRIEFNGDAGIDDLRSVDNAFGEDFVKWRRLRAAGMKAETQPFSLQVRELDAEQPYARVIIGPNRVTNVRAMLAPEAKAAAGPPSAVPPVRPATATGPKAAPAAASRPAALPIEIRLVRVIDGSMNFADLSIKPNFATGIQELNGTIKGLSGRPDARAEVQIDGKVERYAPVKITGQVNYFAAVTHTDLQMSFHNMELTAFSPYSGKFAGYRIDRGKLSIDLNYKVENRKLEARHKLIVSQLELGERVESPDATELPVKLAVALLKDRDGVINLELPLISGSLDDPEFSVAPLIWKFLVGLVTKIVTSPFALLGSLFGAGEELATVEFSPGSALLDAAARGRIATLAHALESRPALNLDVPLVTNPDVDRAAVSEQRWQDQRRELARRRLGARAAEPRAIEALLASPGDYRALLEEAYRSAFQRRAEVPAATSAAGAPAPDPNAQAIAWLEPALRSRIVVDPADLDELAKARASAVQVALLEGTGIDPGRVFIVTGQGQGAAPAAASDKGQVRLQLALH